MEEEDVAPLVRKRRALEDAHGLDPEQAASGAVAGPSSQGKEMELPDASGLRGAFKAGRARAGPMLKRPKLTKKHAPKIGTSTESPVKENGAISTHEQPKKTQPPALYVLAQLREISWVKARDEELRAAQESEQSAKATLAENEELKKKLDEVEAKAKEEAERERSKIVESSNQMEEMLYHCWDFNQHENFTFLQPGFWEPYLAKFKIRFSQEPSETVDASNTAEGDGEELTSTERVDGPQ
ncbi:uncharacterized protein LOC133824997 [Humulus lupulus]|uniref:uncharacterized protein LOC133824997 n=1 Tax=Humulus lupulus TaxID=3486 RepID=UPI002B41171A|nr:uncharacterized protein LOC133824997 [Humulus lupulus]